MTKEEKLEYLVKLGLEAFDRTYEYAPDGWGEARHPFEINLRDRMAQAVQVWILEGE